MSESIIRLEKNIDNIMWSLKQRIGTEGRFTVLKNKKIDYKCKFNGYNMNIEMKRKNRVIDNLSCSVRKVGDRVEIRLRNNVRPGVTIFAILSYLVVTWLVIFKMWQAGKTEMLIPMTALFILTNVINLKILDRDNMKEECKDAIRDMVLRALEETR